MHNNQVENEPFPFRQISHFSYLEFIWNTRAKPSLSMCHIDNLGFAYTLQLEHGFAYTLQLEHSHLSSNNDEKIDKIRLKIAESFISVPARSSF